MVSPVPDAAAGRVGIALLSGTVVLAVAARSRTAPGIQQSRSCRAQADADALSHLPATVPGDVFEQHGRVLLRRELYRAW